MQVIILSLLYKAFADRAGVCIWLLDHLAVVAGLIESKVELADALFSMYASLVQQGETKWFFVLCYTYRISYPSTILLWVQLYICASEVTFHVT